MPDHEPGAGSREETPPDELTGRDRLLAAVRRPSTRGQVIVAVLLALVGFASVVQVQSRSRDDTYAGARQQDLIQLLDSLSLASERAEREIVALDETRDSLLNDTETSNATLEQAREQANALSILAGTVPATGEGIVVTVRDPAGGVGIDQLLNGLEELRDAGAEAIEINNTVRVVAQTSLSDGGTEGGPQRERGVVVDGQPVASPYTIEAIGDPNTLAQALAFTGGFTDEVEGEGIGGEVSVKQVADVSVSTVVEPDEPEYAEPVPQE